MCISSACLSCGCPSAALKRRSPPTHSSTAARQIICIASTHRAPPLRRNTRLWIQRAFREQSPTRCVAARLDGDHPRSKRIAEVRETEAEPSHTPQIGPARHRSLTNAGKATGSSGSAGTHPCTACFQMGLGSLYSLKLPVISTGASSRCGF